MKQNLSYGQDAPYFPLSAKVGDLLFVLLPACMDLNFGAFHVREALSLLGESLRHAFSLIVSFIFHPCPVVSLWLCVRMSFLDIPPAAPLKGPAGGM